jgi:GNAT superfamily N-acetyltransferase
MHEITIRHAQKSDALGIAEVQVRTWRSAYDWRIPSAHLDSLDIQQKAKKWETKIGTHIQRPILVACRDDIIVWFISGWESREKPEYDAEITAFYVRAEYQWQGIGKMLFVTMIQQFLELHYHSFYIWVLEHWPAIGFYEYMWGIYLDKKVEKIWDIEVTEVSYWWRDIQNLGKNLQ